MLVTVEQMKFSVKVEDWASLQESFDRLKKASRKRS